MALNPVAMDALKQDEAIEAMNIITEGQVKEVEQGSSVSQAEFIESIFGSAA